MAPRGFDRYMVSIGAGRHRKFVRFTDPERCAHFLGVLSLAAQSPRRGYLLVSEHHEVGAEEVASEASVTCRQAASALEKLKRVGVLKRDEEAGAWFVHGWDDVNPAPGAERTRRWRDGRRNADVMPRCHASVTKVSPEVEVEVEVEVSATQILRELFSYWQERCGHPQAKPTRGRLQKIEARLKEGYADSQIRRAIDGAARAPYVNEQGKRFDDIELICRSGEKLESFIERADARVVPPKSRPEDRVPTGLEAQIAEGHERNRANSETRLQDAMRRLTAERGLEGESA